MAKGAVAIAGLAGEGDEGMGAIASPALVELCRAQVDLLTGSFGATLAIVYLARPQGSGDGPMGLVPVVMYPAERLGAVRALGAARRDRAEDLLVDPLGGTDLDPLGDEAETMAAAMARPGGRDRAAARPPERVALAGEGEGSVLTNRLVVPLVQKGAMLGVLALDRPTVPWTTWERGQIDRVAQTLALACGLDRQRQWFEGAYNRQRQIGAYQRDLLHDLLHQFRNPLTAVRTFGKLLLRRLQGQEREGAIAANLLRESERLQQIALQVVQAIDLDLETVGGDRGAAAAAAVPTLGVLALAAGDQADGEGTAPGAVVMPTGKPVALLPGSVAGPIAAVGEGVCAIAAVWQGAIATAEAVALERSLTFLAAAPEVWPLVLGDGRLWREVLGNVLDNAIKYAAPGGRVRAIAQVVDPCPPSVDLTNPAMDPHGGLGRAPRSIAPEPGRSYVAIAVTNSGPPIPPEDLPNLFGRHYRGSRAAGPIEGSGLGLAIVRELVERMGGAIELFSPAIASVPGSAADVAITSDAHPQGTTVLLWLAIAPSESP
ncbi:MAG: GAF domain-containing sensor histidine kinase [Cyanophyceae cyanobacterium]